MNQQNVKFRTFEGLTIGTTIGFIQRKKKSESFTSTKNRKKMSQKG